MKTVHSAYALLMAAALAGGTFAAAPQARLDRAHLAHLFAQLDDDDYEVRGRADKALRAMGKAVLPLVRAERERASSLEVRYRLGKIAHALSLDERVADLVRLLGANDPQYYEQAERALHAAGPEVVPILKAELSRSQDAKCKARLAKILEAKSAVR